MSKTLKATWMRTETSRDRDEWMGDLPDGRSIDLERTRPYRYHGNGVSGLVTDMDAPVQWEVTIWDAVLGSHTTHTLEEGLSVPAAKKAAIALAAENA